LAKASVSTLKTQQQAVNARWKRLSQHSYSDQVERRFFSRMYSIISLLFYYSSDKEQYCKDSYKKQRDFSFQTCFPNNLMDTTDWTRELHLSSLSFLLSDVNVEETFAAIFFQVWKSIFRKKNFLFDFWNNHK